MDASKSSTTTATFLTKWGAAGFDDGEFYSPFRHTTDSPAMLYVADSGNNRIQKFCHPSEEPETPEEPSSDLMVSPTPSKNFPPIVAMLTMMVLADSTQA